MRAGDNYPKLIQNLIHRKGGKLELFNTDLGTHQPEWMTIG